ncbi:MAG: hypothetical protein AAB783_01390 [Patescibacteria group bacterium]
MKKSFIVIVGLAMLVAVPSVFAETSSTTPPRVIREEMRKDIKEFHGETKDKRDMMREDIHDKRASTTEAIRDKRFELNHNASTTPADRMKFRESMNDMRKETHEFAKNQRDAFKEEFMKRKEVLKDKLDGERKILREKLGKIKDERKKQTVESISNRFAEVNNNILDNLSKFLNRLDEILVKIKTRTDAADVAGKDVSKVKIAIIAADGAIKSARDGIKAQVGKTYPIAVTTENALGDAVSKARHALYDDLEKVRTLVKSAHSAVKAAARALHDIPRVDDDDDDTTSTSTPPTATTTSSL